MTIRIQKWGNSFAIRIPKAYVDEMKIGENSSLQMTVYEGALIIMPDPQHSWDLAALLAGVTKENKHEERDSGGKKEKEEW
jgi:antitoxin MazE